MDKDDSPNDPGHVGPKIYPDWLDVVRQVVMFLLGVWLIVFSSVTEGYDIPFLITGLILFGMIPVERIISWKARDESRRRRREEERNSGDDPSEV